MRLHNQDLKHFHQIWWEKKVFCGLTWNQVILIGIGVVIGSVLFYQLIFNGDWVFGLRP